MNSKFAIKLLIVQALMRVCFAGININPLKSQESTALVQTAVKIIETCYDTRMNPIGIGGNSSESLIIALSTGKCPVPIVLVSNILRMVDNGPVTQISRYRLQIFAITVSSSAELKAILVEIEKSRWWNHMANFYILDWPINEDGCSRAHEILSTAWKMNLPEAKFMCVRDTEGPLIYSFNPYTTDAPDPWQLDKIYRSENGHPWALLVRRHRGNRDICENMNFDKTKDLGGYEVRATIRNYPPFGYMINEKNKSGVDAIGGYLGDLAAVMFRHGNASVKLLIHDEKELLGGGTDGFLAEVVDRVSDIGLIDLFMPTIMNMSSTYPHRTGGMFAMTQYRGYKSQLSKLVSVLDLNCRVAVCVVIIVTVIFMKYFLNQDLATSILNTTRLILNSCLVKPPTTTTSRIYLSSLFIFVITILGIYQGKFAALLTKKILLPNIDTMQDLAKSDLTVYGHVQFKKWFDDPAFKGRYFGIDTFNCTEYVLRYPRSAACIHVLSALAFEAARRELHLSKYRVIDTYINWPIRSDWPLEERINRLMQRLVEADIFEYMKGRSYAKSLRTIARQEHEGTDEDAKIMTLSNLSFAFVILGVGLGCATICFIIETAIDRRVARMGIAIIVKSLRNQF